MDNPIFDLMSFLVSVSKPLNVKLRVSQPVTLDILD